MPSSSVNKFKALVIKFKLVFCSDVMFQCDVKSEEYKVQAEKWSIYVQGPQERTVSFP